MARQRAARIAGRRGLGVHEPREDGRHRARRDGVGDRGVAAGAPAVERRLVVAAAPQRERRGRRPSASRQSPATSGSRLATPPVGVERRAAARRARGTRQPLAAEMRRAHRPACWAARAIGGGGDADFSRRCVAPWSSVQVATSTISPRVRGESGTTPHGNGRPALVRQRRHARGQLDGHRASSDIAASGTPPIWRQAMRPPASCGQIERGADRERAVEPDRFAAGRRGAGSRRGDGVVPAARRASAAASAPAPARTPARATRLTARLRQATAEAAAAARDSRSSSQHAGAGRSGTHQPSAQRLPSTHGWRGVARLGQRVRAGIAIADAARPGRRTACGNATRARGRRESRATDRRRGARPGRRRGAHRRTSLGRRPRAPRRPRARRPCRSSRPRCPCTATRRRPACAGGAARSGPRRSEGRRVAARRAGARALPTRASQRRRRPSRPAGRLDIRAAAALREPQRLHVRAVGAARRQAVAASSDKARGAARRHAATARASGSADEGVHVTRQGRRLRRRSASASAPSASAQNARRPAGRAPGARDAAAAEEGRVGRLDAGLDVAAVRELRRWCRARSPAKQTSPTAASFASRT